MKLASTFNFSLLASALFLITSTTAFADKPPAQALGSGVFFYAWNANGHCSTDTSINPTGKCPTLWTDTIKNINAQVPANSDRAKIKFIYLDSVSLNLPTTPISKSIFTVGGCADGTSADIVFCSRSAGLTYSNPQSESGYQAVSELTTALGSGYYIIPMISDQGDTSLESLSAGQLQSLAYSLACIVNSSAAAPAWTSGFTGGPSSCTQVLTGSSLNPQNLSPTINGLGFDIEGPDLSNHKNADPNSAVDFYTALQTSMGSSTPSNPKFIMVSRGPNGLNENQNNHSFGTLLNTLNSNSNLATFIFGPQIYDLCDGFGTWACPVTSPFNYSGKNYSGSLLFQPIPAYSVANGGTWDQNDIVFSKLSSSYQFFNQLNGHSIPSGPGLPQYPLVPVQLMISGGGSSQIWSHANLYNADFSNSSPKGDQFLTGVMADAAAPISFQPSMIYENKRACQAENPDGSLGATIPNCVTYPNPYFESLASYANTLFSSLQYAISANNTTSVFSGITLYPFTPYGFWDTASKYNTDAPKKDFQGYFPEIPDGLVNGQKPQISFWDAYLNQFANQWIGSSTGTIPTQTSIPVSKLFITLPAGYYTLNPGSGNNLGTATVLVQAPETYPNNPSLISNIASYKANLIDAIGQIVATGTSSTSPITINNAPGGNYKLDVQALDSNGNVLASTEVAAEGPGLPPVPAYWIDGLQVVGTPTSSSYTLRWTLHCTTPPSGFLAVSQLYASGNSSPLTRLTQWIGSPACGQTYPSIFALSKGSFSTSATQASLALQAAGTFQNIALPIYVPITIPSP